MTAQMSATSTIGGLLNRIVSPEEVELKINGNAGVSRHLDHRFHKELKALLAHAKFANVFVVTVGPTTVKGTPFTKGLHISAPNGSRRGVEIMWHGYKADNASRVPMILSSPPGMDPFEFHRKLKAAQQELAESDDDIVGPLDPVVVTDLNGGKDSTTVLEIPRHVTPAAIPGMDTGEVELFMREIFEYLTSASRVAKNVCEMILHANFKSVDAAPVLEALVKQGYLLKLEDDQAHFGIGQQWLESLRTVRVDTSPPRPASAIPSAGGNFEAAANETASNRDFVHDLGKIESFMRACLPFTSPKGVVRRSVCWHILKEGFGYIRTGSVTESLVLNGHLSVIDNDTDHYLMSPQWLEKLRPPPSEDAVDTTIEMQPQKTVAAPSPGPVKEHSTLAALAELQRKAGVGENLRKRLAEVDGEIKHLDDCLDNLQKLRVGAVARRARIEKSLQRPDIVGAQEQLNTVKKFLNL